MSSISEKNVYWFFVKDFPLNFLHSVLLVESGHRYSFCVGGYLRRYINLYVVSINLITNKEL